MDIYKLNNSRYLKKKNSMWKKIYLNIKKYD